MNDTPKQSPRPFAHKVSKRRLGKFEIDDNSISDAKGNILIAENHVSHYDCKGDFISLATGDWHLFAAAPEMLEVLHELDECAVYWSEYDVPLGIHDRIKAAIAKAEGRQE
jgi:hypothetical protein